MTRLEFWGDLLDETNEKETIREIPNTNKKNAEDDDEGHKGTTERDELNISYWLHWSLAKSTSPFTRVSSIWIIVTPAATGRIPWTVR